ncbi:MAG: aminotransferase class I/II-fold pyridoxal phosphate-dependent enzyme [Ardenticatenaceae bacterium]|nr:aminotransferase class I/II-fold pyridoxal phosphate-dependent enzyme [Ardenticatenaceae bacterium]
MLSNPIPDFKLERYFARWEFAAPYILCASDVEGYRLDELLALADDEHRALWQKLTLGYTEAPGHPLLRAEIATLYQNVAPANVLTFAGAEEAIFVLMNVLLGPGDHAVITWPGYQSLYEVARATGAEVMLLPLEHADGWALHLEALQRALRPTTRLIVVNFPHNPTGALPDRASLAGLVELAREAGAHLFSDEVYRFLEFDPADRLPAAVDLYERAISLGVMSKAFALAGLRVGWLATRDGDLLRRAAAFKDYTSICNSAPSEILALIALRAREAVLARSLGIIERNLAHLDRFFAAWAGTFEWVRPRAGSIGFPRLRAGLPVERFATDLVEQEGVLLLPGTLYDHPGNHFRIGFGRSNLPEALARLERFATRRLNR